MFDRVQVINLDRAPDRWQKFQSRLPVDWPFPVPERFSATDGNRVTPPHWWQPGPGAWGAFRSHYRILEEALNAGLESIMVLEDDAECCKGFAARATTFLRALPDDWAWIYFGGQHLDQQWGLPTRVNRHVYRPYNVHRSHAFALRGRKAMEFVFRHLNTPTAWRTGDHVDHRMGELHKNFPGGVYVPDRWLIGQGANFSSIKLREVQTNFFADAVTLVDLPLSAPFVAVVGVDDAKRSNVAAALHHLGITMGEHPVDSNVSPHQLIAEVAPGLDGICGELFDEHGLSLSNREYQISRLRWWANRRENIHRDKPRLLGGSHTLLSLMLDAVCSAWNRPRVVHVRGTNMGFESDGPTSAVRSLCLLSLARLHQVGFQEVIEIEVNPESEAVVLVETLCQRLAITATTLQREHAAAALR